MKAHVHLFRTPSTRLHLPSSVLSIFVKNWFSSPPARIFLLFSVAQTSCNSYYSIKHPWFNPRPGGARRPEAGAPEKVKPGKPAQRLTITRSLLFFDKLGIPPGAGPTTRLLRGHERTTQTLALRNTRVREGKVKRTHEWRWETVCYLRVAKVHTYTHTYITQTRERERDIHHTAHAERTKEDKTNTKGGRTGRKTHTYKHRREEARSVAPQVPRELVVEDAGPLAYHRASEDAGPCMALSATFCHLRYLRATAAVPEKILAVHTHQTRTKIRNSHRIPPGSSAGTELTETACVLSSIGS